MPRRQNIRLKDTITNEYLVFGTLQEACDYINGVTGGRCTPGTLHQTMKRCGALAKKRFLCCPDRNDGIPEPDRTRIDGGWEFAQYGMSERVMVAEGKLKWYDEERMEEITRELRKHRCRVFWDMESSSNWKRKKTRVEIYMKFPEDTSFENKILILKEIIKEVKIY